MDHPPVAWLYTDIEGSTRLWQANPRDMPKVYARHDAIIREAMEVHSGRIDVTIGDAFHIQGPDVESVVSIAIAAQRQFQAERWPLPEPLRVRMAIHQAPTTDLDEQARAQRHLQLVVGAAHGEQILLTSAALNALSPLNPDWTVLDCGDHLLRGSDTLVRLHQITAFPLRTTFPPLNTRSTHPSNLPARSLLTPAEQTTTEQLVIVISGEPGRLVTLVGPSSNRSLAVAIQTADCLRPAFPGGTFLIGDHIGGLTASIMAAIGIGAQQPASIEKSVQAIGHSRMLLIISTLETTDDLVPTLAHLLANCPHLHLLAIAADPLASRWERIMTMDGEGECVQ